MYFLYIYSLIEEKAKKIDSIIYSPTNFTIPEFLAKVKKFTNVYTGPEENNITASQIILNIMKQSVLKKMRRLRLK